MMKSRRGFTLVELLVVLAILAMMMTIALPGFNNFQEEDFINQQVSDARIAYQAFLTVYMGYEDEGAVNPAAHSQSLYPTVPISSRRYVQIVKDGPRITGCGAVSFCSDDRLNALLGDRFDGGYITYQLNIAGQLVSDPNTTEVDVKRTNIDYFQYSSYKPYKGKIYVVTFGIRGNSLFVNNSMYRVDTYPEGTAFLAIGAHYDVARSVYTKVAEGHLTNR